MKRVKANILLTQERVKSLFNYEPLEGSLTYIAKKWERKAGASAVYFPRKGNSGVVYIEQWPFQASHIIWLYVHGYIPTCRVRYSDRDVTNLKLDNICLQIKGQGDLPTQAELREYLNYDPLTGTMVWVKLPPFGSRQKVGGLFGCHDKIHSRMVAGFNNCQRQLTSFIWCYMTGEYPKEGFVIDHKNGNTMDNSWVNLREITQQQNLGNLTRNRKNTKYLRGVAKNYYGKFHMRCIYKGVKYGGRVRDTQEEAHQDYIELHKKLHGEFSNYVTS